MKKLIPIILSFSAFAPNENEELKPNIATGMSETTLAPENTNSEKIELVQDAVAAGDTEPKVPEVVIIPKTKISILEAEIAALSSFTMTCFALDNVYAAIGQVSPILGIYKELLGKFRIAKYEENPDMQLLLTKNITLLKNCSKTLCEKQSERENILTNNFFALTAGLGLLAQYAINQPNEAWGGIAYPLKYLLQDTLELNIFDLYNLASPLIENRQKEGGCLNGFGGRIFLENVTALLKITKLCTVQDHPRQIVESFFEELEKRNAQDETLEKQNDQNSRSSGRFDVLALKKQYEKKLQFPAVTLKSNPVEITELLRDFHLIDPISTDAAQFTIPAPLLEIIRTERSGFGAGTDRQKAGIGCALLLEAGIIEKTPEATRLLAELYTKKGIAELVNLINYFNLPSTTF